MGSKVDGWELSCEYLSSPLGIENPAPRFSWEWRGAASLPKSQCGYRINVKNTLGHCVWDSGWITSKRNYAIPYEGDLLTQTEIYHWSVQLRLVDRDSPIFIGESSFETGLCENDAWGAEWISHPHPTRGIAHLIRRSFVLEKIPQKAMLYLSGLGYAEVAVNGIKPDQSRLDPGWTDYKKTILYRAWNITHLLIAGENVLSVELGEGWHGLAHDGFIDLVNKLPSWLAYPKMLCRLTTDDITITTQEDGQWLASTGAVQENSIYQGEVYDARLEKNGWRIPGYEASSEHWLPACKVEAPGGVLRCQIMPAIGEKGRIKPVYIDYPDTGDNTFVVDFGVNISGWVEVKCKGKPGQKIIFKYAELRHSDGQINQSNLRSALATDTYIFGEEKLIVWAPRFTYHGFRYVQVFHDSGVTVYSIQAIQIHSLLDQTGNFSCSNQILNSAYQAVIQTELNNLHSLPTDCPQRDERLGWLNDATVRCEETIVNFNAILFFEKWLRDIEDSQDPRSGAIPDTAPYFFGSLPASHPTSSYVLIPWYLFLYYGDIQPAKKHYSSIRKYICYKLAERSKDGVLAEEFGFGDWAAPMTVSLLGWGQNAVPANISHSMITTSYLYLDCKTFSQFANLIGNKEDSKFFSDISEEIKAAINGVFLNKEGFYSKNTQGENAFALYLNLMSREIRTPVLQNLLKDIREENKWHVTTGNQMTKYLYEVLGTEMLGNDAYKMASQEDYPSIGFMLKNGATTIWERWENLGANHMNSHDHPMLGAYSVWFQKYLGGIQMMWSSNSGLTMTIAPTFPKDLDEVTAQFRAPFGVVLSKWQKTGDTLFLEVHIPWNGDAELSLAGFSGHFGNVDVDGLLVYMASNKTIHLTSGRHSIKVNNLYND